MAAANGIAYNKCPYLIKKKDGPIVCGANCLGAFCWNHKPERREKMKQYTTRYQETYRASENGRQKYNEYHKNYKRQKRAVPINIPVVDPIIVLAAI